MQSIAKWFIKQAGGELPSGIVQFLHNRVNNSMIRTDDKHEYGVLTACFRWAKLPADLYVRMHAIFSSIIWDYGMAYKYIPRAGKPSFIPEEIFTRSRELAECILAENAAGPPWSSDTRACEAVARLADCYSAHSKQDRVGATHMQGSMWGTSGRTVFFPFNCMRCFAEIYQHDVFMRGPTIGERGLHCADCVQYLCTSGVELEVITHPNGVDMLAEATKNISARQRELQAKFPSCGGSAWETMIM